MWGSFSTGLETKRASPWYVLLYQNSQMSPHKTPARGKLPFLSSGNVWFIVSFSSLKSNSQQSHLLQATHLSGQSVFERQCGIEGTSIGTVYMRCLVWSFCLGNKLRTYKLYIWYTNGIFRLSRLYHYVTSYVVQQCACRRPALCTTCLSL